MSLLLLPWKITTNTEAQGNANSIICHPGPDPGACTPRFATKVFTTWDPPCCPAADEWIKKEILIFAAK